jgi:hypothetical protein
LASRAQKNQIKYIAIGAVCVFGLAYASFETFASIMSKMGKEIEIVT